MATGDKLVNLNDLKTVYDKQNANEAMTEASLTASAPHPTGSYFFYGGVLYQTTADIANGGTIVTSGSGANCKAAKLGDDVASLKSATDANFIVPIEWTDGYYLNQNGDPVEHASYQISGIIVLNSELNFEYKATVQTRSGMYVVIYDNETGGSSHIIERLEGSTSSPEVISVTTSSYPGAKSIRLTNNKDYSDAKLEIKKLYDTEVKSVAYTKISDVAVKKEQTTFAIKKHGINLFDQNDPAIKDNTYISDQGAFETANYCCVSGFIPVESNTTYCHRNESYMGYRTKQVNYYNESKELISTTQGTESSGIITFTTPNTCKFVRINVRQGTGYKDTFMLVKGSSLPATYYRYISYYTFDDVAGYNKNHLSGKIAVFDGDSICNGTTVGESDPTYGWGWAGRIGTSNAMEWCNAGINGATIAYLDPNKHCLSRYIETIHTNYPALDYLILEGGTNDADIINGDQSQIGTFDETDFDGPYDDTTFCGALEQLFYKALLYYPKTKIGFIVAQKMGVSSIGFGDDNRRYKIFDLAMQICKKWGIPYINLWDDCPLNPDIPSMYNQEITYDQNREQGYPYYDGQHLTAAGYDVITPKIEAFMRGL